MRNLSILSTNICKLPTNQGVLSSIALDADENVFYVANEEVEGDDEFRSLKIDLVKIDERYSTEIVGTYTSPVLPPSSYPLNAPLVLSLHLLSETRSLVIILANGDLVLLNIDESGAEFEVVGSFEVGLESASWSTDETLLILFTGDGNLVQMTNTFDVLYESDARPSEFGQDAQVNVNWGSKATQFHGSLGKAAAAAANQPKQPPGSSPDDDQRPRIHWRGDSAFFTISSLDSYKAEGAENIPKSRRIVRVYDRAMVLQSTLEDTPGLEHVLAWRPSGNFIATTQRFFNPKTGYLGGGVGKEGRHDIVFYERNGLRRREIDGRWHSSHLQDSAKVPGSLWSYKVKELSWSSDSNILGVWIESTRGDIFQLWTTGNWHWYLKQEIPVSSGDTSTPGRFHSFIWHPENPNKLILTTSELTLIQYEFVHETCTSTVLPPKDLGTVAVIDGNNALLTPFRIQNVPPPMAAHTLKIDPKKATPSHIALSTSSDSFALLWSTDGKPSIDIWMLNTRTVGGRGKIMIPELGFSTSFDRLSSAWQIVFWQTAQGAYKLALLGKTLDNRSILASLCVEDGKEVSLKEIVCEGNGRLLTGGEDRWGAFLQTPEGLLMRVSEEDETLEPTSSFPVFCPTATRISLAPKDSRPESWLAFGLSASSKLFATSPHQAVGIQLATNVTSFTTTGSFLIYTTTSHESIYVRLTELAEILYRKEIAEDAIPKLLASAEQRRVERGSRIVVATPSAMGLTLQMPRGNLETVYPRAMVQEVIHLDLAKFEYRTAFLSCRKHRIDLNFLVDHDPRAFIENIPTFVEQVHEVDYINLFLSGIGQSTKQSAEEVAEICDRIREQLQSKDMVKYVNSILTAHVVKRPPDYEGALSLLHQLRETQTSVVEDAVRYIIFLADADKMFDTALGMYDFTLVLLIAQHSQRDPREYLPFLRELFALEKSYQKFRINDYLKRYVKALSSLREAGSEKFEEAIKYIELHRLYAQALELWRDEPAQHNIIMDLYGDHLFERKEYIEAALAFNIASKPTKAMMVYEKARMWQSLFALAEELKVEEEALVQMGYRVAEELASRKRWTEAAQVYLDYARDVREAVSSLVNGNEIANALRISHRHQMLDLIQEVVRPGALDLRTQFGEDIEEMKEQLTKQSNRLTELREKKESDPNLFFGIEDPSLRNIDVMTDVSAPITTFTRYTVAQTATSKASKRTSRSKRKSDLKTAAGRKGTVDEEVYILNSLVKLTARLVALQADIGKLLPHLLLFSDEHKEEGKALQEEAYAFEKELRQVVETFWKEPEPVKGDDFGPPKPPTAQLPPKKPEFGSHDWKIRFI